ncbi:beta-defensin 125 [Peromyscus eremicus]|uniref:beta-defensin 125 n=1 Tax=Peromyscus eremicus TaxID=42410 RepID=UPI0027DBEFAF|nr:beta-defensin 125 [Peromyscus eremicus]
MAWHSHLLRFITHDTNKGESLDPLLDKAFWVPQDIVLSLSGAMSFPSLAFVICGLLTQVTKAGWSRPKCWKNNLGHCRIRCLDDERYILLCRNKASCCIPRALTEGKQPPQPQPSLANPEDVTFLDPYSVSSRTRFNDDRNFDENKPEKTTRTPVTPGVNVTSKYPNTVDVTISTPGTVTISTPGTVTISTPGTVTISTPGTVNTPTPGTVNTPTPGTVNTPTLGTVNTPTPSTATVKAASPSFESTAMTTT